MHTFKVTLILTTLFHLVAELFAQEPATPVRWTTIEHVNAIMSVQPKKIFIDVYTDWCGWCKKMDATTFADSTVAGYMNQHFHAVKFNAERKDSVHFVNRLFINDNPAKNRYPHQLAVALLNGKMSYPSYAFLNEEGKMITVAPGYMKPDQFMLILRYVMEEAYLRESWDTFKTKNSIKE